MSRALIAALLLTATATNAGAQSAESDTPELERAHRLLERHVLIDGHNDVPWQVRERFEGRLSELDFAGDTTTLEPPMHTDLPRLHEGRVGGQFWSVYVDPAFSGDEAVRIQLEQLDIAHRLIARHDALEFVTTADGIEQAFGRGRIASLLGLEGGHTLNNSLAVLRMYHRLGARYLTLTHWQSHDWADAATDQARHGGLSEFGNAVVREMNRLGMLVDLSHASAETMHDALDISEAPVIFSHSSAAGVTGHPRNVPDNVLDRLPDNGGIVMVTFVRGYVDETFKQWDARMEGEQARLERLYPGDDEKVETELEAWKKEHPEPSADLSDVAGHIDYIRERIGAEHIGIGGDFDGISAGPEGLEDVSTYPDLFAELIRRGYSEEELAAIAGGNLLRVMRAAEGVAERLNGERVPSEARYEAPVGESP